MLSIKSETIFDDKIAKGIPPPGCTLPPQKKRFFIFLLKFGCLIKDDIILLLELPYSDPLYEFVFDSKSIGL